MGCKGITIFPGAGGIIPNRAITRIAPAIYRICMSGVWANLVFALWNGAGHSPACLGNPYPNLSPWMEKGCMDGYDYRPGIHFRPLYLWRGPGCGYNEKPGQPCRL